jgi:hypothetical protein
MAAARRLSGRSAGAHAVWPGRRLGTAQLPRTRGLRTDHALHRVGEQRVELGHAKRLLGSGQGAGGGGRPRSGGYLMLYLDGKPVPRYRMQAHPEASNSGPSLPGCQPSHRVTYPGDVDREGGPRHRQIRNVPSIRTVPHCSDQPSRFSTPRRLRACAARPHPGRRTSPVPRASDPPQTGRTGLPARQIDTHAAQMVTVREHPVTTCQYVESRPTRPAAPPTLSRPAAQRLSRSLVGI